MTKDEPYHYVRWTWFNEHNLEKLAEELANFTIVKPPPRKKVTDLMGRNVGEFEVQADTLLAFLSSEHASLFQKEKAPFTEKDIELRKAVFVLYPHSRATPLPFGFRKEPKFELKESEERKKAQ